MYVCNMCSFLYFNHTSVKLFKKYCKKKKFVLICLSHRCDLPKVRDIDSQTLFSVRSSTPALK